MRGHLPQTGAGRCSHAGCQPQHLLDGREPHPFSPNPTSHPAGDPPSLLQSRRPARSTLVCRPSPRKPRTSPIPGTPTTVKHLSGAALTTRPIPISLRHSSLQIGIEITLFLFFLPHDHWIGHATLQPALQNSMDNGFEGRRRLTRLPEGFAEEYLWAGRRPH